MGHRKHTQSPTSEQAKAKGEALGHRHHNFTIELFLDEVGEVSDIFIDDHDLSEKPEKISGWKPEKIIDFIALHAGIQTPRTELEATITNHISTPAQTKRHVPPSKTPTDITGTLHLHDLKVISPNTDNPTYLLPQGQPFTVRFTLDLAGLNAPRNAPLVCDATIIAKQPGYADQNAGKLHKKIDSVKSSILNVTCTGLNEGMYRLGALVKLMPIGAMHARNAGLIAFTEGGDFVEVF